MQWRPFPHVPRVHNDADVCDLAQINGITVNVVRNIKYFLFEYLVIYQLINRVFFFIAHMLHQLVFVLEQQLNAILTTVLAGQMQWRAFLLILRHHEFEAFIWVWA